MAGLDVILHRDDDFGAPELHSTAGQLIVVLDAVLVNGYNQNAIAGITRVGTVATVTFAAAHNYNPDGLTKIEISGANQAEYNGVHKISNVTTLSFDFDVTGNPVTPATGTMTVKVPSLGWSKTFSGTNKAAYQSSEATATQLFLRIDDSDPFIQSNKYASARGYETMTDVDTGTGLFPTVLQMSGGIYIKKSDTANSIVPVKWRSIGDGFEFHFFNRHVANTAIPVYQQFHFGDPISEKTVDNYGCLIYGSYALSTTWSYEGTKAHEVITVFNNSKQTAHFMARSYSGVGGSVNVGKLGNHILGSNNIGTGNLAYPSPINNGLYLSPLFVVENGLIRAQIKSMYQPLHSRPLSDGSVLDSVLSPINRTIYAIRTPYLTSNNDGETHFDFDGPWR